MKMWSFYRRRSLLIGSANVISPFIQHSSSRLHLSAGKNTICSSFSVFSPMNVASKSKPRLVFYQRFDLDRRFYHPHSFDEPNKEPTHKPFVQKLKNGFDSFCSSVYHLVLNENNTVPYTNRTRFLLIPIEICSKMHTYLFKTCIKSLNSIPPNYFTDPLIIAQIKMMCRMFQFLPETDPQSVRVRWILKDITDALYKDLEKNGVKPKHLDGLKWEIFVTPESPFVARSLPGGNIYISSKFLRDFTTDAEVATCIGHEIAHIVAGHFAERITTFPLVSLILLLPRLIFTYLVPIPCVAEKIRDFPFRSVRRNECEADYIGMILIALAGYDPQVAPFMYAKLAKLYPQKQTVGGKRSDLSRTHPPTEERAPMLSRVMEEAQAKYKEVEARNWILPRTMGGLWLLQKD